MQQCITATLQQSIHAAKHQVINSLRARGDPGLMVGFSLFDSHHLNRFVWTIRGSPFSCFLFLGWPPKWYPSGRKNSTTSFHGTSKCLQKPMSKMHPKMSVAGLNYLEKMKSQLLPLKNRLPGKNNGFTAINPMFFLPGRFFGVPT